MHEDNEIQITTYDRLLRAWEYSMEMTRNFEMYSKRIVEGDKDDEVQRMFKEFAEDEGVHASKLRSLLLDYKNRK